MIPRHEWLRSRVKEIICELDLLEKEKDWEKYVSLAFDLSNELQYTCSEWDKYYRG